MIENKNDLQIYCDMDGVLVDFDKQFIKYARNALNEGYVINGKKFNDDEFWEIVDDAGVAFWATMRWLKDGFKLWNYIKPFKPKILSAPSIRKESTIGKKIWLKKNGIDNNGWIFERNKFIYADKNCILIDDFIENIQEWRKHGGIGIHHKNFNQTVSELKKLGVVNKA